MKMGNMSSTEFKLDLKRVDSDTTMATLDNASSYPVSQKQSAFLFGGKQFDIDDNIEEELPMSDALPSSISSDSVQNTDEEVKGERLTVGNSPILAGILRKKT